MKKIIIILLLLANLSFGQFSFWEYHGQMKRPVAGADIWQNLENFYVIGGYSDSLQSNVNWVQKYRVYFDVWKLDSMSVPRFGLVAENFDNRAIFFGGVFSESNSVAGIELYDINVIDNTLLGFNPNFNRIFSTAHVVNNNLFIIGGNPLPGTGIAFVPYIAGFDLVNLDVSYHSDTLFHQGELPEQQMSEVIGNDIYIFGGIINGVSQDIYKFNVNDHTFEKLNIQLLQPRAGGRAVIGTDPNRIYIIGGYNESFPALKSVEIFSAYGDQYFIEEGPELNEARYNFMSAYLDETIYVLGGFNENGDVIGSIEKLHEAVTTAYNEENILPSKLQLYQNYPNPFNPTTTIKYSIPINSVIARSNATRQSDEITSGNSFPRNDIVNVQLTVYDILGREVAALVNQKQKSGSYEVSFDAGNLPSGIYYYQLRVDSQDRNSNLIQTKKMILLK